MAEKPTSPKPTQPKPTQPKPTQPKPSEPNTAELTGWLGRGIDLFQFDPFGEPRAKPTRILVASPPQGVIERLPLRAYGYHEQYADSLLEITHKLTVEAGLKGSYGKSISGSVNSKFGLTEKRTEKRHFLKISYVISGDNYFITRDKEAIKNLLHEDFKNALAKSNVDDLFDAYGTHLIKSMIIGGRAEYFCQSSDLSSIDERTFKIAAKAKYKAAGGSLEGTSDVETVDKQKLNLVQGSIAIEAIGGSAEAAAEIKKGKWKEWAKSSESKPAFLGFGTRDGLLPIWDLAADAARRNEIYEAYKRRSAKAFPTEILSMTSDVASHPEAHVTVPEGYKLLSGGAKDNWSGAGNMLTASFPESDNTWRASGKDHMPPGSPASITAFALVLYDPDDIWETKIFKSTSPNEEAYPMKEVAVDPGYVLVGGGAQVHWHGEGNLLFASYPKDKTTWRAHSKEHEKSSHAKISAYAIGLKSKVKGVTVQSNIQQSESYRVFETVCNSCAGFRICDDRRGSVPTVERTSKSWAVAYRSISDR